MSRWILRGFFLVLCVFANFKLINCIILIRPDSVYESMIQAVHQRYNNTCIILFHATANPIEAQGLEEANNLLTLQTYLSTALSVRTAIMDFETFTNKVGNKYYYIKRPLFVILNDLEDVQEQFVHVSRWIAMAYPTWLIFLRKDSKLKDFFSKIYVPFDCTMLVSQKNTEGTKEVITEVYQIFKGDQLRSMIYGTWDAKNGLKGPRLGLYQRRSDLYGHNIRVVSVHDPPASVVLRGPQNETIGLGGFFGGMINLLQEGMNCTFSYIQTESWGIRLTNGTWTGSIKMLLDGEADLAATELTMTSDRLNAIEFTTPVYSTKCRVYIKRPDTAVIKWNAYLAPFAIHIWNSIALLIILSSGSIVLIKVTIQRICQILKDYQNSPSRFAEIMFYVFGAFCSQGMEPSLLDPVRMVQLVIHLTGVVVLAAYSAALISFLAVKTFVMPFTTMLGLLKDGTYRFAVVGNSSDYTLYQNTSDKILSVMFKELLNKESDLPNNYLEGLRRVCSKEKYAFMTVDNMAAVLQEKVDCSLESLDSVMQITVAMAVPANSPYRGIINSNILLLKDSGLLQRLLKSEWSFEAKRATSKWTSVEIEDVMPLFIFLLGALVFTGIVFIIEQQIHRKITSRGTRRKTSVTKKPGKFSNQFRNFN